MRPILPGLRRAKTAEERYAARYIIAMTVTLGAVLELVEDRKSTRLNSSHG